MLERDAVMATIEELLDRARRGRGGAVFVIGEAGLGKTSLLDRARHLAGPGVRAGQARGDRMEAAVPFGLLAQAVEDLGGGVLGYGAPGASADDARASQAYRTLRWLQVLADTSPVLLALDDLHWADPDSLALLSYLCRRILELPVAVVATLRPWPPAAEELCLDLAHAGFARVERLVPLSEEASRALLAGRVRRELSDDALRQASASSAGNPLLLEQVALAFDRDEPPGEGGDGATRGGDGAAGPAVALEALLLRRFAGLPEEGVLCARAASVLGRRFRPELATSVARLDEGQSEVALEALSRTGLVRHVEVGLAEFTHPLFRQALYDGLPPLVREELHARAFRSLLERGRETEAAEHAARGNLLGDADAVAVLARAGRAALGTGAVATALERLERAVALAGERPDAGVLLSLGEALVAEGRHDEAVRAYERVLDQPGLPADARTEALRMLGRALFLNGDPSQGERRFEEAVALAPRERPEAAVRALLDLSRAAWLTAGPAGALPAALRARDMAQSADGAARVEAQAAWGLVAFVSGDPAGLEVGAPAAWEVAGDASVVRDLSWNWGTLRNTGRAAKYSERFALAGAVFDAMFVQAEQVGSPHAIASLAAHHADTLVRQGRLDQAWGFAARAVSLADLAPVAAAFAHVVAASLLLHGGRLDESEASCRRAERAAAASGQWLPLLRVWQLRARRHLREGRFDEACELYLRLEAETARLGIGEPCLVPWARSAVIAHLGRGRPVDAERVLEWVEGCSRRLPCRWPRVASHAGRAAVAAARGDHDDAETHLRAALALHDEVELALERIETLLQWGSFLRRTGRVVDGRVALREALALAERTGASWLAGSVRQELTVARGRRGRRASPDSLTPQERRVAELAARGRSSREIAGQLSLSARTIETHLRRVYAKLGIHSQRELMARAGSGPLPPTKLP